jgi:hypothetical protein
MSALMISLVPGQSRVEVRTIPIWALGGLSFLRQDKSFLRQEKSFLRQNELVQLTIHFGAD